MYFDDEIETMRNDIIDKTIQLVKIKSIKGKETAEAPFGVGPYNALNWTLDLCENLGFKIVNLNNYLGYAEIGDGDDYIGVLGHLDVVPEGSGWTHMPYEGQISDGKIYGRGTMDDKGPIIAAIYGLKAIKDSSLKLNKKIRIIFGTNEESGCGEVEYYLKKEKPPVAGFTPDAEFPVINGEKGITFFQLKKDFEEDNNNIINYIKGGNASNMVPDYCQVSISVENLDEMKIFVDTYSELTGFNIDSETKGNELIIESKGISAHGSTPELGVNAIVQMLALLGEMDLPRSSASKMIEFLNTHIGFDINGEDFNIPLEDGISGKLTLNLGKIYFDRKGCTVSLNVRYPVTESFDNLMKGINKTINGTGIEINDMIHQEPLFFEEDHKLVKTLMKVYKEYTGKEEKAIAIGGGTYAKEMPNIVAYGPLFPGDEDVVHQADEYIEIEKLILISKMYASAMYELAK
ncbi:dipeptidase PepV [Clostridium sp. DL1XJH146]